MTPRCEQRPGFAARGFTLIETMVVVMILAIVAAAAAPSYRGFIGSVNSKSTAFDLINDLTVARSEAIRGNQTVTVAPVGGDWAKGWRVFTAAGETLRTRDALASSLAISGSGSSTGVIFTPNGRTADDTASANMKWTISSSISGVTARCVVVSPTGSARSVSGSCA